MSLQNFLKGRAPEGETDAAQMPAEDAPETQQATVADTPEAGETPAQAEPAEGVTTAPEERRGPQDGFRALRQERNDHKERAARAEAERDAVRAERDRLIAELDAARKPASGARQVIEHEQGRVQEQRQFSVEEQIFNAALNLSEANARDKYPDFDEKAEVFMRAAQQNPALVAEAHRQPDPWGWAIKQADKLALAEKVLTDPTAYEAQLRAKWEAEQGSRSAPSPSVPQSNPAAGLRPSLATARSSAPRSAPAHTGPTPWSHILRKE